MMWRLLCPAVAVRIQILMLMQMQGSMQEWMREQMWGQMQIRIQERHGMCMRGQGRMQGCHPLAAMHGLRVVLALLSISHPPVLMLMLQLPLLRSSQDF